METAMTFEAAITRLEEITLKIEDPNTAIEDSVLLYKEATELIKKCTGIIDEAEMQVKTVLGEDSAAAE